MRVLRVGVMLTDPLFDAVTSDAGGDAARLLIAQDLSELTRVYGVMVGLEVHLARMPNPVRGQPLRVTVDGRLCLVPARRLAEALAYATRSHTVRSSLRIEDLLDGGMDATVRSQVLAWVVRAAVSGRPDVLVAGDDPLAALLRLGVSIAGEDHAALRDAVRSGATEATIDRLAAPTLDLYVEPDYFKALTTLRDGAELFSFVRDGLVVELGVLLPSMHVQLDPALPPRGFAFRVNELRTVPRIGLELDSILVNDTPDRLLSAFDATTVGSANPATGQPSAIAPAARKVQFEEAGLTTWDAFGYYILVLAEVIRTHAAMLVTPARTRAAVDELSLAYPMVTASFDDAEVRDVVTPLLRDLLAERISIRNLRHILQLVRSHAVAPEVTFGLDRATFVRRGLAGQIAHTVGRGTNTLVVYLVDKAFEDELSARADGQEPVGVELAEEIRDAFHAETRHLPSHSALPAVLTTDDCRQNLRDILRGEFPTVRVLTYQDLPGHYQIQPVARISRRPALPALRARNRH